jgi:hypothetical protein
VVRVKLIVNVPLWPGASVSDVGVIVLVMPANPCSVAVYVEEFDPTLVAVRLIVCVPASAPMAIDGTLRSLGSSE